MNGHQYTIPYSFKTFEEAEEEMKYIHLKNSSNLKINKIVLT